MRLPLIAALSLFVAPVLSLAAGDGWRDMLRDYLRLRDTRTDCLKSFPGFDPEMARLGEAFAATAYPDNPAVGRKNFRRLALRLRLSHPDESERERLFLPNKEPWAGYSGEVDSGGLVHFLFNTGTLPMPLLDHPIVRIVLHSDVSRGRVRPAAECAARIIRAECADISVVEYDAAIRAALIAKIRKSFDAAHRDEPMTDDEAKCLEECLPYMA